MLSFPRNKYERRTWRGKRAELRHAPRFDLLGNFGVYLSSMDAALFELNNVARIEVLKGPQGTLFGRNPTGGVIQIITKDPSSTPSADIQVGYGNYATSSGSFYGTTNVGESVALDLTAYGTNQVDGRGTDLVTGQPTFTHRDFGARSYGMTFSAHF